VDFETTAGELYGLLPDEFTSARSLRVREARSEGDRGLAAAISDLRRPTIGAWLANQLTRQRKDELEELLGLGTAMRKAQEVEDGHELRRLSQQRRRMVSALVLEARHIARTCNQPVSENSSRELENTLEAGVADADAADSLRSGRLAVGLDYSGFGSMGSHGSMVSRVSKPTNQRSGQVPDTAEIVKRPKDRSSGGRSQQRQADSTTGRSRFKDERSKLEKALAEAQSALVVAEDQANGTHELVSEVQAERDRLVDKTKEVERLLRETREALQAAEHWLTEAQRAEKSAQKDAMRAKSHRDKAEALLHRSSSNDS
jgi:hypothetical protein